MKKKDYEYLIPIGIFVIGLVISFLVYQQIPNDKKWLFWLLSR